MMAMRKGAWLPRITVEVEDTSWVGSVLQSRPDLGLSRFGPEIFVGVAFPIIYGRCASFAYIYCPGILCYSKWEYYKKGDELPISRAG